MNSVPGISDPVFHLGDGVVEDAETRVEVLDHAQPLVRLPEHLHPRLQLLDLKQVQGGPTELNSGN